MRGVLKRGIAIFSAVLVVGGLVGGSVFAQNSGNNTSGNGFRISPVKSEIVVEKGKSTTLTITLENPTDFLTVAKPAVNDFIASSGEDGEPRLILDDKLQAPGNSFKGLIQPIGEVTLKPHEKKDIPVKISAPQDAHSGGYYGAIRFMPSTTNTGGNVSLTASVGTIVLVTVPGNLIQKVDLVQIGASQKGKIKGFITSGDVSVAVRLKNSGDIHVQPFGKVSVKNMFGHTVKEYELNTNKGSILPNSIRRYEDAVAKPKGGWIGRYTIQANLGYAQGSGDLITTKAVFWYIPTWSLYILLVLALAIAAGIYFGIRYFKGGHKRR